MQRTDLSRKLEDLRQQLRTNMAASGEEPVTLEEAMTALERLGARQVHNVAEVLQEADSVLRNVGGNG